MANPNEDYYGWTQETIEKLRQGRLSEVNWEELIEELESMGSSERRELKNRLAVLLAHLLKWRYQPERQGKSRRLTIKEQRIAIKGVLKDNPSLRSKLQDMGDEAYSRAVVSATRETDKEESAFPATFEQTGWT